MNYFFTMSRSKAKGEDELLSSVKNLVAKLCTSDEFINQLTKSIIETIGDKFDKEINVLKDENLEIKKHLKILEEQNKTMIANLDKHDQVIRSNNLRFYGILEKDNENILQVVKEILKNKMALNISEDDIEYCYRIGRMEKNKNRAILIRFYSAYHKNVVYKNKRSLKATGIVVREDLTTDQLKLLKVSLTKIGIDGKVWTNHGNIFVKFNDGDEIIKITNLSKIQSL